MTDTVSPFSKTSQHSQKRQAILSEAARLFNTQGTRATTLIDIASRLKLTKTSLYYYVKTKEELIYLCYLRSCEVHQQILSVAQNTGTDGRTKIEAAIREYFRRFQAILLNREPQHAVMTEIRTLRAEHRTEVQSLYFSLYYAYRDLITEGIADGSLEPCNAGATALALFGNIQWTVLWLGDIDPENIPTAGETFIDIVMNGLSTNPSFQPINFPELSSLSINKGFDRSAQNQLKQEAFYKVGSRFFNRKGFKGTSLDEIAEALNVTKGAFYYHIKDKDDLLLQCFNRTLEHTRAMQTRAIDNGKTGLDQLELAAHYLFYIQNSDEGPLIRYNLLRSLKPENQDRILKETQAVDDRFGELVQLGIRDNSIRNVNASIAEQFISGGINSCLDFPELSRGSEDIARNSADYFQMIFRGMGVR